MPCVNRRGCVERFRDQLSVSQLTAILAHHGSCANCGNDVTDNPRFRDSGKTLVPYCPGCFEERWATGASGPFEYGKPRVFPVRN